MPKLDRTVIRNAKRAERTYFTQLTLKEYWQERSAAAKEYADYLLEEDYAEQMDQYYEAEADYYDGSDDDDNFDDSHYDSYDDDYYDYEYDDYPYQSRQRQQRTAATQSYCKYGDFQAEYLVSYTNLTATVTEFNGSMAICTPEGPILITKEQAMKFFDLVEAPSTVTRVTRREAFRSPYSSRFFDYDFN